MTDVVALAQDLYHNINSQKTPDQVEWTDLVRLIINAIKDLYVISGRTFSWSYDKITYDESGVPSSFEDTLE